jgi:adenylate cyclase
VGTSKDDLTSGFSTLGGCTWKLNADKSAQKRGRCACTLDAATVLFADTVDFTTFSERSGEEAAFTLMRSLSKLIDDAVREQGGVVQAFTGDGIMAVFGAPIAPPKIQKEPVRPWARA